VIQGWTAVGMSEEEGAMVLLQSGDEARKMKITEGREGGGEGISGKYEPGW